MHKQHTRLHKYHENYHGCQRCHAVNASIAIYSAHFVCVLCALCIEYTYSITSISSRNFITFCNHLKNVFRVHHFCFRASFFFFISSILSIRIFIYYISINLFKKITRCRKKVVNDRSRQFETNFLAAQWVSVTWFFPLLYIFLNKIISTVILPNK